MSESGNKGQIADSKTADTNEIPPTFRWYYNDKTSSCLKTVITNNLPKYHH